MKRYGRSGAISKFEALFNSSPAMQRRLGQLTDKVLLCHCSQSESCHGDVLIRAWEDKFLNSEEQDAGEEAAQAEELFRAAEQRQPLEEPESQSEDEPGQEPRGAGWRGVGKPLCVGRGTRSPGRWPIEKRPLPQTTVLQNLKSLLKDFVTKQLKTEIFAKLACGRVDSCPFGHMLDELREQVYVLFEQAGEEPRKKKSDRPSPLEFRSPRCLPETHP